MDLKSCTTAHFIQTISGGLVMKIRNINSCGRPVIKTKMLKDIYKAEDSKMPRRSPSCLVFDCKQVKCENPCLPVADRKLQEIKPKTDDFVLRADDDGDSGSDDDITLKQLRNRFLTKKRKHILGDEYSKQDDANWNPVEDDSDLNEPIVNLKLKRSKISKAKRKPMNISVVSFSAIDFAIKSEENLVSEGCYTQAGNEQDPVICVKVEVPDSQQLGYSPASASTIDYNGGLNPVGIASNGFQEMVHGEYIESLLCTNKYQYCVTNEISYDHLEDAEPNPMLAPWDGKSVKLESLELGYKEFLGSPPLDSEKKIAITDEHSCIRSLSEDPNSDMCSHSRSPSNLEDMLKQRSTPGIQAPDMAIDGVDGCMGLHQELNSALVEKKPEGELPYELDDYLSSPEMNCHSNPDSNLLLTTEQNLVSMEDIITDGEQPSTCSFDALERNVLNGEGDKEDELLETEKQQNSASPITDEESQSSLKNRICDSTETISTSEPHQPPERLHSTRKAISPSSQEQLRLAMSSIDIVNDASQNIVSECKEKYFDKPTEKKASFLRRSGQRKVTSPRCIIKKSQIAKGNLESPRFSHTLHNLSTGCTSLQGCSESAIAFSQRQMHDMESLSVKLMSELKSMKEIVEQKLLFEAYRNASLKNDADEVKLAISNATKVEEMSKKWLSIMARDCNRFCKIMKMTPYSTAASNTVPRERRKIVFADEAGGKLCHVKFFEDGPTSPESDGV